MYLKNSLQIFFKNTKDLIKRGEHTIAYPNVYQFIKFKILKIKIPKTHLQSVQIQTKLELSK